MSKDHKFGGRQKHGSSRANYFSGASNSIAKNKQRRINKEIRKLEMAKGIVD